MDITIYGTPVCPNCKNVTTYLKTEHVGYVYETVGKDITQEALEKKVGHPVRSVPVIIADGKELSFMSLKTKITISGLTF